MKKLNGINRYSAVVGLAFLLAGLANHAESQTAIRPVPGQVALADLVAQVKLLTEELKKTKAWEVRQEQTISDLKASNDLLAAKLACVAHTSGSRDFIFDGCNVHVRNGMGHTGTINKYGNLIIGYNKNEVATRTGSHNLVLGDLHEYRSHGGIVSGELNTLFGPNATILGGHESVANGPGGAIIAANKGTTNSGSVVIGGTRGHTASGAAYAVVIGGTENYSTGRGAVAVGGTMNEASGGDALACGGTENRATGNGSTACGGSGNLSQGLDSVVGGGLHNTADSRAGTVSGGHGCSTGAIDYKWVVGVPGGPGGCSSISN